MSELTPNSIPYIVSADVPGLLDRWASTEGYRIPSSTYFEDMSSDLATSIETATGNTVEVVPEKELRDGMEDFVHKSHHPVISLDRAYFDADHPGIEGYIDVTRAVKEEVDAEGNISFASAGVISPRPGFPPINDQLEALRTPEDSPITLLDDVIFSGEGAVDLANRLRAVGRPVAKIIAGIGIQEGINRLQELGIEVECVRTYEEVIDEVCQRDFLAGVPMSGRTVFGENGNNWSAPYFLPYGNPENWASIPADQCAAFSRFCMQQSVDLWSEVEAASGRLVPAAALPRTLRGANGHASVTMLLQKHLGQM